MPADTPNPGPLAFNKPNPWAWLRALSDQHVGIYPCAGTPTNGTSGFGVKKLGPGALVVDITNSLLYINTGTIASPTWTGVGSGAGASLANGDILVGNGSAVATAVAPSGDVSMDNTGLFTVDSKLIQRVSGTISAANIIGTGAGQLGHANGVVLEAAPGANLAWMPIALAIYYTFATAAYTAGGNLTLNWGAGGAALTGLVSAANSLGAASSKAVMLFPLATVGVPIVSNASLNLVSSVAFTNPGTAAGTVAWELWYRKMTVGF